MSGPDVVNVLIIRIFLWLMCIVSLQVYGDTPKTIIYSSAATVSKELIRHEMKPVSSHLASTGQSMTMVFPKDVGEFFLWAKLGKFDFVVASPDHSYVLKKYFNYLSIMESVEMVSYLLASNLSGGSTSKQYKKALVKKNDLLSPYFVNKLISTKNVEYHQNLENLLISLIKQPNAVSVIDGDDAFLLPPSLREKIKLGKKTAYGRLMVMCRPSRSVDCLELKRELLAFTSSWSDPEWVYTFLNLYHFRECCEKQLMMERPLTNYLDRIMTERFSHLIDTPLTVN